MGTYLIGYNPADASEAGAIQHQTSGFLKELSGTDEIFCGFLTRSVVEHFPIEKINGYKREAPDLKLFEEKVKYVGRKLQAKMEQMPAFYPDDEQKGLIKLGVISKYHFPGYNGNVIGELNGKY